MVFVDEGTRSRDYRSDFRLRKLSKLSVVCFVASIGPGGDLLNL